LKGIDNKKAENDIFFRKSEKLAFRQENGG
jgi:hypothetical protein